ncbi:MAG: endo-1,4-beta-xylanase [Elusimicrobia bacterium]|nr:endo-1,4-beta-xylanase [Elusimicrobiota bacterium]
MMIKWGVWLVSLIALGGFKFNEVEYPLPDYTKNSPAWYARNDSYIPAETELPAILQLAQSATMTFDLASADYDKDGVLNQYDPSSYDWRETGYNPFAALAFLNWDHQWNYFAFKGENLDKAVAALKKAGIAYVRMDFSWSDIEPSQGKWDFSRYDRLVKLLSENNIRILGIFSYCAGWAANPPDYLWCSAPVDNKFFTNYATAVIKRYKNQVKYWEVWNEPDSRTYWRPQDMLVGYTALLKEVYQAAKAEDPSCKILIGGLAEGYKIEWLYKNGGKDYFDIVNFHILISPLRPAPFKAAQSAIVQVKKIMSRFGDSKKRIWITELGCPGVSKDLSVPQWWNGPNPDEQHQSDWVKVIFTELTKEEQVDKIFWAFFRDTKAYFGNGVDYFGLIGWDFTEKPGYKALAEIIKNWKPPK